MNYVNMTFGVLKQQGYLGNDVGPAILYKDNMSTMALMKRGGPGSEHSRHINIHHFWLAERVEEGEAVMRLVLLSLFYR